MYFIFTVALILAGYKSHAYPTYAAKHRVTQCTACHVNPAGGGIQNLNGKSYGARAFERSPLLMTDLLYADWRFLYSSNESKRNRDGAGIMAAIVGGQVPLIRETSENSTRLVINHSVTGFATNRETYLQFRVSDPLKKRFVNYVQVGRLPLMFGFRTDEHRSYTRMISQTTFNDFVMGVSVSGDPLEPLHYDIMAINGESSTAPDSLAPDKSSDWGEALNLRWTSPSQKFPVVLGASFLSLQRGAGDKGRAGSTYFIWAFDRWTDGNIPVILSAEFVQAKNFNHDNSELSSAVATNYFAAVERTESRGLLVQVDWDLERWVFTYKMDQMFLDTNFPADYYVRHGLGFRYYFAPGTYVMTRYELARATHPEERNGKWAADDTLWAFVRASF